jgi:hypothetical protein
MVKMTKNFKKNSKAQMLLLTGITMVLIFISATFISTRISNISVESSLEKSHPLSDEFLMVKTTFNDALSSQTYGLENFESLVQRFSKIEARQNIIFDATTNYNEPGFNPDTDEITITLTLKNSDTQISENYKYV